MYELERKARKKVSNKRKYRIERQRAQRDLLYCYLFFIFFISPTTLVKPLTVTDETFLEVALLSGCKKKKNKKVWKKSTRFS